MADMLKPKVHVRSYTRTRFGHLESVREHWRSWPNQLAFNFDGEDTE